MHIMSFSEESRVAPSSPENDWREQGKETDLVFLLWLENMTILAHSVNFTVVANERVPKLAKIWGKRGYARDTT